MVIQQYSGGRSRRVHPVRMQKWRTMHSVHRAYGCANAIGAGGDNGWGVNHSFVMAQRTRKNVLPGVGVSVSQGSNF